MGTRYSSQSISGYNSTPPPDDGSVSESNKVKWSTIKNKLTDPAKVLAEAVNTAINTALDYGPISVVSAAVTLGASHNNQFIELSGASTPTLNSADGLGAGWFVDVKNIGASAITIARTDASDMINDVTADVTMNPLDYIRFVVNAAANGFQTVDVKRATSAQVSAGTVSDAFITPETLEPPVISGLIGNFYGCKWVYDHEANSDVPNLGDITSTTSVDTWETHGPTGSGASNIHSALDAIPTDAKFVTIWSNINVQGSTNGDIYSCSVAGRPTGSSFNPVAGGYAGFENTSGTNEDFSAINVFDVRLDSNNTFELKWTEQGTTPTNTITLAVKGFKI